MDGAPGGIRHALEAVDVELPDERAQVVVLEVERQHVLGELRPVNDLERVTMLTPADQVVAHRRRDDLEELDQEGCDLVELERDRREGGHVRSVRHG